MTKRALAIPVTLLLAVSAHAQERGGGSGRSSATPPVTKSEGPAEERALQPARQLPIAPRHGLLGAPGAAPDASGSSRLGPGAIDLTIGEYRPAGPLITRPSGDRIRSWSSADVRETRRQQAPDIEREPAPRGGR